MKSVDPSTGKLIKEYYIHTDKEIEEILQQVDEAWQIWKNTSFVKRAVLMKQAARILHQRKKEYSQLITAEMGKLIGESEAEVEKSAWVCDYYAEHAEEFLSDEQIKTDGIESFVAFEPLGPILAVMPWNFPFWQVFRFAAPALMAGNAGVLKHASNVPGCALAIQTVFRDAGFPDNLFRSLMVPGSRASEIIAHDVIKAVTLTGSEAAGSKVAETAGKHLKKTVLELGGSDPFIVLEDADLDDCIETAVKARMINCGQSCIAAKRFIVEEAVAPEFIEKARSKMAALKPGDPSDSDTGYAPMARQDLADDLKNQIERSVKMGARVLLGGKQLDREGYYFEPTVIIDVTEDMPVFKEETFGPVMAIIKAENRSEAVRIANNSSFGLGGCLWTSDIENGILMAREIESGAVFVNGMVKSDPRLPFGGIKRSGYGRELSHFGIREFVNIKTIWVK
jgi:succinate-semialdehyde dehydrogenase / glutarate-semialdehyde dehydrogenase